MLLSNITLLLCNFHLLSVEGLLHMNVVLFSETCTNGKFHLKSKEAVVSHHLLQQEDVWFSYEYVILVIVMCVLLIYMIRYNANF